MHVPDQKITVCTRVRVGEWQMPKLERSGFPGALVIPESSHRCGAVPAHARGVGV